MVHAWRLRSIRLLTIGLVAAASCRAPAAPQLETFAITGIVRANDDQSAVDAATVRVTGYDAHARWTQLATMTDGKGAYRVDGLRGDISVTASKLGFHNAASNTTLSGNAVVDLSMERAAPYLPPNGDLLLNQTFSGTLPSTEVHCEPQWDARAPCRFYGFRPTTTRSYTFELTFPGCEMEVHIFRNGSRLVAGGRNSLSAVFTLPPDDYVVRLMAYYSCELFEISVR